MTNARDVPWGPRSPAGIDRWDDVVVGSGMGGMTVAALLSRMGRRVLVLEQHDVAGGFTHEFKRKRWKWDVGVHVVGEVTRRSFTGRLLADLTDGALEWNPLGDVYDAFEFPDLAVDFPADRERFVENLVAAFPGRGDEVRAYVSAVRSTARRVGGYWFGRLLPGPWGALADRTVGRDARRLFATTTDEALDGITRDARLRTVVTAQWGYYGLPPARSSWALHAVVAKHFLHGGYYPVGGAHAIAEGLLSPVARAGGWTRINCPVAEIVVDGGRTTGVRLASGETVRAERVFSAANAVTTVTRLLPPHERARDWARALAPLEPSACHVCLYLGFKGDIAAAGATKANRWFFETWDPSAESWHVGDPASRAPVLYCSFPSLKDPQHDPGPEGLHTGEVVTFVPYSAFAKWSGTRWMKRGADYEAFKDSIAERMLAQFLDHMPGLRPHLAYHELSTPLSTEHFANAPAGSIYGAAPTPARFANPHLRPRTPVRGLFLAGSDVTSGGVMGAFMGGLLAVAAAEPVATARILARAR